MNEFNHYNRRNPKLLELLERKQSAVDKAVSLALADEERRSDVATPPLKAPLNLNTASAPRKKRRAISAYEILSVAQNAEQDQIYTAYRAKALLWHPDRHDGANKAKAIKCFQLVTAAYEALKTPAKRAAYDKLLKAKDNGAYSFGQIKSSTANDNQNSFAHKALETLETIFWPFEAHDAKHKLDKDTANIRL